MHGKTGVLLAINKYRIASVEIIAPAVKVFRLEPIESAIPPYSPGQYMFLHVLDGAGNSIIRRPYSIASPPSAPYLEFAIDIVGGQMTSRLDGMKAGDILGVEGPSGHMMFRNEKKAAFVAGGTGISPFMSMLRHVAEKKLDGSFILFYSSRTRDRLLYHDELVELRTHSPNIRVIFTLTRESPEGWAGEYGRICEPMIGKHIDKPSEYDWWVCGPPEMVKGIRGCLSTLGVDLRKVRLEGWG